MSCSLYLWPPLDATNADLRTDLKFEGHHALQDPKAVPSRIRLHPTCVRRLPRQRSLLRLDPALFHGRGIFNCPWPVLLPLGSTDGRVQTLSASCRTAIPSSPSVRRFFQFSRLGLSSHDPRFHAVGRPIRVDQVKNPTQEQIAEVQEKYIKELMRWARAAPCDDLQHRPRRAQDLGPVQRPLRAAPDQGAHPHRLTGSRHGTVFVLGKVYISNDACKTIHGLCNTTLRFSSGSTTRT